jgi:hypothetical protein
MKKLLSLLIMLPILVSAQQIKPVASIYAGVSMYHLNAGAEAGVAGILDDRYSLVTYAHFNSIGNQALLTVGIKFWGAMWLDLQQESFVAPVIALQNRYSHEDEGKYYRSTTALLGIRYQVYGGFGEIIWQPGYAAFTVGYQFGNRK